jgi:predicted nucleotidyltransferase
MEALVSGKLDSVKALFRKYGAESAYLFGSAASGQMTDKSDVDFIFSFPTSMDFGEYADNYFALADALEKLLGKKVDLVAEKTLKNPYLIQSIEKNKVKIL